LTIQRVTSKLAKTDVLLKNEDIRRFIPATERMTRSSLAAMLDRYGMVYAKPDIGTYGNGVIRVDRSGSGYRLRHGTRSYAHTTFEGLYGRIRLIKRPRPYVVQQGIHLLKHANRRFDLRVMVQRRSDGEWETTGVIGRLGAPRKIVTNYHNGGTLKPFSVLMSTHLPKEERSAFLARLHALGTSVARQLQTRYPSLKEIGLDVAVDAKLHPWILEVNTCPDPFIFRKLADKSIFRRIYRYAAAYGKFNRARRRKAARTRRRR